MICKGENGFKPVIARLGVDHKGKIHVIFRIHPIGSSKYVKATIGLDGKREKVDFLISAASISNYPILEQGVIGQDGNWFHPCMIETPLGEGAYIGRNTIWKLTLNGNLIAYNALDTVFDDQLRQISVENIQKTVADYYKIKVADMYSKKRPASIARPRQIAMFLAKELTQKSLPEIGELFGGRDHTTVLHAVRKIGAERQQMTELNQQLHVLEQTLKG